MAAILVGSPDASLLAMLDRFLTAKGHLVTTSDTPNSLVRTLWLITADLLVVDLAWPEADIQHLRAYLSADAIIGSIPAIYIVWPGFNLGSTLRQDKDVVLVKPLDVGRLEATVNSLLQRGDQPEPATGRSTLTCGSLTLNSATFQVTAGTRPVATTPTEFSILHELMRRTGEVVTVEELLQNVWGYAPGLGSPELIRVHIKNLRGKLAAAAGYEFNPIRTVPRHGYLIPSDVAAWTS